jgi:hypothetical protein
MRMASHAPATSSEPVDPIIGTYPFRYRHSMNISNDSRQVAAHDCRTIHEQMYLKALMSLVTDWNWTRSTCNHPVRIFDTRSIHLFMNCSTVVCSYLSGIVWYIHTMSISKRVSSNYGINWYWARHWRMRSRSHRCSIQMNRRNRRTHRVHHSYLHQKKKREKGKKQKIEYFILINGLKVLFLCK